MSAEHLDVVGAWRGAFEQAWRSFGEGNFGIGAVITDPASSDRVVAVGRNLVVTRRPAELPLAGNYMAHAEMNAYATLDSYNARGLRLTTTLQPCLMCAAAGIFLNIASVEYAAPDEFFEGLDDELWPSHPYSRDRQPPSTHTQRGRVEDFARLLPLIHTISTIPESRPAELARRRRSELVTFAESDAGMRLRELATAGATLDQGFAFAHERLAPLA